VPLGIPLKEFTRVFQGKKCCRDENQSQRAAAMRFNADILEFVKVSFAVAGVVSTQELTAP